MIDARTEITTQLLSEKGYAVSVFTDGGDVDAVYCHSDFEKKFFSENTNRAFCKAFLDNALTDPVSGETGKTIVFCVSQNHAAKITNILNEYAMQKFPNKYMSDFAMQVTSRICDAQDFAIKFANNNLSGSGNVDPAYITSKTRVCVTVGMMTTGYDCPDILNLCLMRPVFSPTDFIQIKGRGTRKHNFSEQMIDAGRRNSLGEIKKERFKLFDFFANCEYFERKFKYDEVLLLPKNIFRGSNAAEEARQPEPKYFAGYESFADDKIASLDQRQIGVEGMKIDRMFFERFEQAIFEHPILKQKAAEGKWEELLGYIEKNILDKPEDYFTVEKLRRAISSDRKIALREIIEKILGIIPYFKTREQLLNEEFDTFDSRYLPKEEYYSYAKTVFKAYIEDMDFRGMIDNGNFAMLNVSPFGEDFKALPAGLQKAIPDYIKDYVQLNKFIA